MPLQIRVSVPDLSNGINLTDPVILENAENISLRKSVSSAEESISFTMPLGDPKLPYLVYTRWWECWDTVTNERLNYGPFESITRTGGDNKTNTGPGRSALFRDYKRTVRAFYYPIDQFFDDLRYENLAGQPRTSALINKTSNSVFYGVSLRSKDDAIDEQTGYIAIGRDSPEQGTIKTNQFWSGTGKADYLTVDLGESYTISRARLLLPWWGGVTIQNNRAYDWSLLTSADDSSYSNVYSTPVPNKHPTFPMLGAQNGTTLYMGESGFELDQHTISGAALTARYWKTNVTDVHAYYGNAFVAGTITDQWGWECGGTNIFNGVAKTSPTDGIINSVEVEPNNDCYASIVEISLDRRIIGRDSVTARSYKQIDNNNRQITYSHSPTSGEMITTASATKRKFEPGTYFRNVTVTFTSSISITDEYNTEIASATSSPLVTKLPAYTRVIQIDGATNSQVTSTDAWLGVLDAFSFGGSYSYTTVTNDYAVLHFRGTSVKWFATIPSSATPATVKIELRSANSVGTWSSWATLETAYALPIGVAAEKVWEITETSGLLTDNTTYEIKITNTNGGYVSIDSFAGYWSASYTEYNEDDGRFTFRKPTETQQLYDSKFIRGTAYEYRTVLTPAQAITFQGDRVIMVSKKGPGYGTVKLGLFVSNATADYGDANNIIPIPGGNPDGTITINLDTVHELPQAVIFDSADYWVSSDLPWGNYFFGIYPLTTSPVYVDTVGVHETSGLSVKFLSTDYIEILKDTCEVLQLEWDFTEQGLKVVPLIGEDTDVILLEGTNTTVKITDIQDISQVATMLEISGGDIEGLPLTVVVEDKTNRNVIGRTIQRAYDIRSTTDYFTLIGAGRTELRKRRYPQRRIQVQHTGEDFTLKHGDRCKVVTKENEFNVRIMNITRSQSKSSGTEYSLECIEWPQIP